MFTGLVSGVGDVVSTTPIGGGHDMRIVIAAPPGFLADVALGASISCSGCCLTAVAIEGETFAVEASAETLSLTTVGNWRPGTRVNLERSLRMGDELGGHLVSGHVDGRGRLLSATPEQGSLRLAFAAPRDLAPFIARKGSVAVDGVSLTVNGVREDGFGVNVIPHTASVTTLGSLRPGDAVNIEIDVLARYVARLVESGLRPAGGGSGPGGSNSP